VEGIQLETHDIETILNEEDEASTNYNDAILDLVFDLSEEWDLK
jgi:hypothetical protein